MESELPAIADFLTSNRKPLAAYVREKLMVAGAKPYLDALGKEGIAALDCEAAGVLLDLACALLKRLQPEKRFEAEEILAKLPEAVRQAIRLPRSDEYYAVLSTLTKKSAESS